MWSKNSASLTQLILDPGSWIRICVSLLPGSGSISKLVSGSGPVKYFFRPCYTGDNYSLYHRRRLEREDKAKVEFILFFLIDRGKEFNKIPHPPQTEATTFAFASVSILLLLYLQFLPSVAPSLSSAWPCSGCAPPGTSYTIDSVTRSLDTFQQSTPKH